jgi:hypothetical protein
VWRKVTDISKIKKFFIATHHVLTGLQNALFVFVLNFFESLNRKIQSRLPFWRIQEETSEHVRKVIEVFEFIVLPASIVYLVGEVFFLKENAFDSMLWGILVFFYSNFLPDLTCVFRKGSDKGKTKNLSGYKKYALLLFTPVFICFLFSNIQFVWKTAEDFHNFKSLTIYSGFLTLLGFLVFGGFPVSMGQTTEMLAFPVYGIVGYLTHLRVDKIL